MLSASVRRASSSLARTAQLDTKVARRTDRKSKVVCTIGPRTIPMIPDLLMSGMNVARINCSHGDRAFWGSVVDGVHAAIAEIRSRGEIDFDDGVREDVCAIAFDTKGPEIRTGKYEAWAFKDAETLRALLRRAGGDSEVLDVEAAVTSAAAGVREWPVARGARIVLSIDPAAKAPSIYVDYPALVEQAEPGGLVYMDDGNLGLRIERVVADKGEVHCVAENAHVLGERKGVHLPGVPVRLPAVSERDKLDLAYAREREADFVFASFIRSAQHVQDVRAIVGERVQIISKIETMDAIERFDEILAASDGIMVARGDLGVDIPLERLFLVQKRLIAQCNLAGKPVITATQMLESMVEHPRPTRAECVDVANAVLDGSDAVMLSGETAKGKYPVLAASTMGRICQVAEAAEDDYQRFTDILNHAHAQAAAAPAGATHGLDDLVESLAAAAVHASYEQKGVKMIVVLTKSGHTARLVAKYRPRVPILAMTTSDAAARSLQLCRGVHSLIVQEHEPVDSILRRAQHACLGMGLCQTGDRFLALLGHDGAHSQVSALHVYHVDESTERS